MENPGKNRKLTRWWFQTCFICFIFTPDPWGFMIQFDYIMFFSDGLVQPPPRRFKEKHQFKNQKLGHSELKGFGIWWLKASSKLFFEPYALPETNSEFDPKNGWLEYYILIGFRPIFRGGLLVSGRVVFWGVGESLKVQKMRKFSSQANDCLKWFQQYFNNCCFRKSIINGSVNAWKFQYCILDSC